MASPVRIFRKVLGYVLLLINTLLSVISGIAVYSVVHFLSNKDNIYNLDNSGFGIDLNAGATSYINIGVMTITNTGLFDFDDFSFELDIYESDVPFLKYNGTFGTIAAQEQTPIPLNFTNGTVLNGQLYIYSTNVTKLTNPTTWQNPTGYLSIRGRYAFSLFGFTLNITNMSEFIVGI